MLACHLRSISRLRTPVFHLEVAKLKQNALRPNTARCFSVTSGRHSDTVASSTGCSDLDSLLAGGDKVASEASNILAESASNELILDVPVVDVPVLEPVIPNSEIFVESAHSAFNIDTVEFTNLIEPAFSSLGLGHGWPSGWAQSFMEMLHIDVGLPWWQTICITGACMRLLVFPIMVIAQRNIVIMNEHQPTMQKLQVEAQLAAIRGEHDKAAFASKALNTYMMAHGCHPLKSVLPMLTQGIFFTSMFFGIRGMVEAPVQSLTTGGTLWFTDLTLADPTFILPVVTAGTLFLQFYLGADGINLDTLPPWFKKAMYCMPIVSIPVMVYFPVALNVYWLTNNMISLVQSRVMKRPAVRSYLNIGEMTKWKPDDLPMTTFTEELNREIAIQRRKNEKLEATKAREKKEYQAQEHKIRGSLLAAFEEEDRKRKAKTEKESKI